VAEPLATIAGPDAVVTVRDPVDLPVGGLLARVAPWVGHFARSDHSEFWKLGVPAIQITDTANFRNPHYHGATDTPDTLDYRRIADIAASTAVALIKLAQASPAHADHAVSHERAAEAL
jgi:Zn-dependent M28 family amino/carboxypeptidase